ncbi:MAG TPA: hypothetical protein VN915_02590 [Elusimicrobiota bacterium]|nr:hypothetical protein [Elusimicrobiota bacterium]
MGFLLAALLFAAVPSRAAEAKSDAAATADKTTIELVNYFLKVDLSEANPKLIDPFLAVKTETLPKKLQRKAAAKQTEIAALLRIHDIKKKGIFVQSTGQACDEASFIKPLSLASAFPSPLPYEEVTEDELKCVMEQTKCTEIDLGCRFSMLIFFEKKKDRIIKFNASDPIMAIVAGCRGAGGTSHFFGMNYTCMH